MLYENPEYIEQLNTSNARINALIEQGKEISTLQETRDRLDEIQNQIKNL